MLTIINIIIFDTCRQYLIFTVTLFYIPKGISDYNIY
jgi:hypothetical protein